MNETEAKPIKGDITLENIFYKNNNSNTESSETSPTITKKSGAIPQIVHLQPSFDRVSTFKAVKTLQAKNQELKRKQRNQQIKAEKLQLLNEINYILRQNREAQDSKIKKMISTTKDLLKLLDMSNPNATSNFGYLGKDKSSNYLSHRLFKSVLPYERPDYLLNSLQVNNIGHEPSQIYKSDLFFTELKDIKKNIFTNKEISDQNSEAYERNDGHFRKKVMKRSQIKHSMKVADKMIDASVIPERNNPYNKISLKDFMSFSKVVQKPFK